MFNDLLNMTIVTYETYPRFVFIKHQIYEKFLLGVRECNEKIQFSMNFDLNLSIEHTKFSYLFLSLS